MITDRLIDAVIEKHNPCIVGLDTDFNKIPPFIQKDFLEKYTDWYEAAAQAIYYFNQCIIDAIDDVVAEVKIQIAFYEQYKHYGIKAFEQTILYAKSKKLIVIEDGKRNDISNTAKAYSNG